MERIRNEVQQGLLRLPEGSQFVVEIELVDGTLFPYKGRITFADPSYNSQTGTFLIRASVDNPDGRAAPEPVRARAPHRRDPPERDPRAAARRAAGREGPLRLGRQQGRQGRAAAGRRRRLVRRRLVHRRRASPPATRSSSTARCGSRRTRRSRRRPTCRSRDSPEAAPASRARRARRWPCHFADGQGGARRRGAARLLKGFAPAMKARPEPDRRHRLRRPHRQPRAPTSSSRSGARSPCATRSSPRAFPPTASASSRRRT